MSAVNGVTTANGVTAATRVSGATGVSAATGVIEVSVVHTAVVAAPVERVFEVVADTVGAPRYASSQLHAEITETGDGYDVVRRWVHLGDRIKSWSLRRELDPAEHRIVFQHVACPPPLLSQRGEWHCQARPDGGTDVTVTHTLGVADPADAEAVRANLDANVPRQLAAYRSVSELGDDLAPLYLDSSVTVAGTSVPDAPGWRGLVAGASAVRLERLAADTDKLTLIGPDGQVLAEFLRVWLEGGDVVCKRLDLPAVLHAQLGRWHATGAGTIEITEYLTLDRGALGESLAAVRAEQAAASRARLRRIAELHA